MISNVLGAIFIVVSVIISLFNTFVFLNSSAYLNYNAPLKSMAEVGVLFPYLFALLLFVFGILLAKDKELESHH